MHTSHSFISAIYPIADLRPTQIAIGMREVAIKRRKFRNRTSEEAARFLRELKVPIVIGPGCFPYVLDKHHLLRALHDEKVCDVPVAILENLSGLAQSHFFARLEKQGWAHPFDHEGRRHSHAALPLSIAGLIDDPFRSLAGAIKRAGAYAKDKKPFSEFHWANFLRSRIERKLLDSDFDRALWVAMDLAGSHDARHLPGWRGTDVYSARPADGLVGWRNSRLAKAPYLS